MRKGMAIFVVCVVSALALSVTSCGGDDGIPIHSLCRDFCAEWVSMMDEYPDYTFSNDDTGQAEDRCLEECTQSIESFGSDNQAKVEDCVDCFNDKAGGSTNADDFWTAVGEVILDCENDCIDEDAGDFQPAAEFIDAFLEDYDEHYSGPHYCPGYGGGNLGCTVDNPFDWDNDDVCDCNDTCSWENSDCN